MKNNNLQLRNLIHWQLPGQRIVKTSIAVTLCLFFYMLRGYEGDAMPSEAAITAIICMQPYIHGTTENGLSRLAGTIIGAVWGFLFLMLMLIFPGLGKNRVILYLLMGWGTLISLHTAVILRRPYDSSLAAIVFICVVIAFPDIENPLDQAFHRILGVLVGTAIAMGINALRLPRIKRPNQVFFLPMMHLTADQYATLSPAVIFRLRQLYGQGAKICLMSKHAPAFQTAQLGDVKITVPMVVMDGAAIYDPNENVYVATTHMDPASCRWLMKRLEGISYFIYTVHRDRNCIYHHGELTELETQVYNYLKRSPYRYYLDNDHFAVSEVLFIKVVTHGDEADRLQRELQPNLEKMKLRSVVRPQTGLSEGCSLYFYPINADMAHAQQHLMRLLKQEDPTLVACDLAEERPYRTEQDALRTLRKLKNLYEPYAAQVWLTGGSRQ